MKDVATVFSAVFLGSTAIGAISSLVHLALAEAPNQKCGVWLIGVLVGFVAAKAASFLAGEADLG